MDRQKKRKKRDGGRNREREGEGEAQTSMEEEKHERLYIYEMKFPGKHSPETTYEVGTFGKEAVPDGDPMGGVGGSRGTARLSSIVPLQLTGQRKHDYAAVVCLGLPPR